MFLQKGEADMKIQPTLCITLPFAKRKGLGAISSLLFDVNFGAQNALNGTAFLVKKWSGNNCGCFQTTNKIINSSAYAQSEAESIQIVLKAKNQLRFLPR